MGRGERVTKRAEHVMDAARTRERALWEQGVARVAGVDEAGVGPLAGPVVAAAVVLPRDFDVQGIDDSKKLTPRRRELAAQRLRAQAEAYAVVEVWPEEIDERDILQATFAAMRRALEAVAGEVGHALVDGRTLPELACPQTRIVGGDAQEPSIAAASILAKVHRDALMAQLDARWPGYGLARHKGYPTPQHFAAIRERGVASIHRLSYPALRALCATSGPVERRPGEDSAWAWRARLLALEGAEG